MKPLRSVIPIHWAGMEKISGVFVCGACQTPHECSDADACQRAKPEDYRQVQHEPRR